MRPGRPCTVLWILAALATAGAFAQQRADERTPNGWMGVLLGEVALDTSEPARDRSAGVPLAGIVVESPAERAGLRARDRVVGIDGRPVGNASQLMSLVKSLAPGSWIRLTVERDGDERDLRLRLGERPSEGTGFEMRRGWIGVSSIELPSALRRHFGAPADAGVMISDVRPGSPAEVAGFELGDVVYAIEGRAVADPRGLGAIVRGGGVGNSLEFTAMRDGVEIVLEAEILRAPERRPLTRREDRERREP